MNTVQPEWHIEPGETAMLLIECPWCGPRDENEFSYSGEAHMVRPKDPFALSDEEWADYLFNRKNTLGPHLEQWCHGAGCRRYFNAERNTLTYQITSVYKIGALPPSNTDG